MIIVDQLLLIVFSDYCWSTFVERWLPTVVGQLSSIVFCDGFSSTFVDHFQWSLLANFINLFLLQFLANNQRSFFGNSCQPTFVDHYLMIVVSQLSYNVFWWLLVVTFVELFLWQLWANFHQPLQSNFCWLLFINHCRPTFVNHFRDRYLSTFVDCFLVIIIGLLFSIVFRWPLFINFINQFSMTVISQQPTKVFLWFLLSASERSYH